MILDASFITGEEKLYYNLPEIVFRSFSRFRDLNDSELSQLDQLAAYLTFPNSKIDSLRAYYYSTPDFRPSGIGYDEYYELVMERR